MAKIYTKYIIFLTILIFPFWGNSQSSFVTFELIGSDGDVCQGKTLGIIATLADQYQNYNTFEWGGDPDSYREIRDNIAIVKTDIPGERTVQFTLNIDSLTKFDTTISINILPKPDVKLSRKGKSINATEIKNETIVSYRWIYEGKVLPNESSNAISNPKPGWYRVVVTDKNGCTVTSEILTIE
jgi:hypothetical protein